MNEDSPELKKIKEQIKELSVEDKILLLERIMNSLEDTKK